LKSALMAGAAVATFVSVAPASAQDQSVEKVVVTGSRIPQKGLTSSSPVSTISATEQRIQGTTSSEELINSMPQVLANQGAEVSNGSSGTATLDLRGIGPQRTLILINGRRLNPASSTQNTPDVNNIALAMVERVEVLTGGASAVYGADAVAGVVNFIYRKNFEGVEVGAQYRITDHENSDQFSRNLIATAGAVNPNEFSLPDKHVNDGRIVQIYGIMGANTGDGKGNVTLFAQYRHAEPILQSERDFSACSIATNGGGAGVHVCQGSSNSAFGRLASFDIATPARIQTATGSQALPGAQFVGATHNFNFGPANYLQRPDERYILGAMGNYDIAADTQVYGEFQFNDDRTVAQIAASGLFRGSGLARGNYILNCDNPFMTPAGVAAPNRPLDVYCLAAGLGSTGQASLDIGRRFVEGGNRQDDFRHSSFRSVLGLKGTLEDIAWDYDVYAQYGQTVQSRTYLNDVSLSRIARSLQVVNTGPNGILGDADDAPICTSVLNGSDTSCVPYDVFRTGTLTPQLLSYLVTPGFQIGTTSEWVVNAAFNGELDMASPWADTNVSAAFGGEYRQEKLEHRVDTAFSTGDLAGQGGPTPSAAGSFDVWEAFGEVSIPLVEDAPWAKQIEINGGYRISDYETAGITHTYKYGGSWSPTEDLRVRGSFQRAVRAPNVVELFGTSFLGLWSGQDPCASTTTSPPAFTATQCANLGLTATQISNFQTSPNFSCPSAQCAARFSGNANLKPEESDTQSFGVVFTPTFLKGFSASVDYFDIFVDSVIGVVPQAVILQTCATDPGNALCSKINRAAGSGILFGSGFIDSPTENLGSIQTTGLDVDANYRLDLGDMDMDGNILTFNLVGTRVFTHEATPLPGGATYDCVGLYGPTCGVTVGSASPVAEWRHKLRATWGTPWDMNISLAWRYISETSYEGNSPDPSLNNGVGNTADAVIRAYDYFDVAFDWSVSDNIKITGGINNVADEDPPILDSNVLGVSGPPFGNANTYPVIYDSLGREVFIGMSTRF
ncbi:MAG: TonB-dependent receptor, partial [Alphaproteobacteria bacterium]|nr:TonB-dependent receptor [Alphaproteobacteria bacterium]